MFGLLFILLIVIVLPVVLVTVIFLKLSHLRSDVDLLKKKIGTNLSHQKVSRVSERPQVQTSQAASVSTESDVVPVPAPIPIPGVVTVNNQQTPRREEYKKGAFEIFIDWIREDWLMKLGAFLIVIAFVFFASYAVINDWVGPVGRITFILLVGIAFMMGGSLRIRRFSHQGGIFMVLGAVIISLGVLAAQVFYDMFPPLIGLSIIFLSMVFLAVTSVVRRSKSLAFSSLVLAGITPFMLDTEFTFTFLFSYLLVVIIGMLWVVAVTGFSELTFAGLVLVCFYSLGYVFSSSAGDQTVMIMFAYIFAAIFFIVNIAGILKRKDGDNTLDTFIGVGNAAVLMLWIMNKVALEWQSLIISLWAAIFLVASFVIYRETKRLAPFYLYGIVSLVMIATATAIEFEGAALTIAFVIETVAVILGTYLVTRNIKVTDQVSILMFGPIFLGLESLTSSAWATSVLHEDFFVAIIVALTSVLVGYLLHTVSGEGEESSVFGPILMIIGSLYIYVMIWLSTHAVLQTPDAAVTMSLLVYTAVGLAAYIYGKIYHASGIKKYGGVLLAFVVFRLILVDVWQMELGPRIFTFLVIGMLLIATAFIKREGKNHNQLNTHE